ncbi:CHAT domain-containing protein [Geodermatophilus sp. SYSU D00691]
MWAHLRNAYSEAEAYVEVRQAAPAEPEDLAAILGSDDRPVVLADLVRVDDTTLGVLALRADYDGPLVETSHVDLRRLDRFIRLNFGSAGSVRELASDMEDLFQHELSGVGQLLTHICDPGDLLVISPFGGLHNVPLGALRPQGRLLLERNPLALLPNASLVRALRSAVHEAPATPAAVFGDPTGDLAGARDEAVAVARRFGVTAAMGTDASVRGVSDALTMAGVLHVAAHAAFDPVDAMESGLVLSDGRLTAGEIITLRAPALSLVTLSACETGVSETDAAEELVGLTRALLFAGADSIVVSLWKVPDVPTLDVMEELYAARAAGEPMVDALRRSVLAARDRHGPERFDRWAGFQLVGDWR